MLGRAMAKQHVTLRLNGREQSLTGDDDALLIDVLRNDLGLKGTRFGCGAELCGACFVLVDGAAVASCTLPVSAVAGKAVTTIEGLGTEQAPPPLHHTFPHHHAPH